MTCHEERLHAAGYRAICGIDEAGRGPLAGPVVAAAVILPQATVLLQGDLLSGLRDSKKLSPRKREHFFEQISQTARSIGVGIVDHKVIDDINILQATYLAMQQGFEALQVQADYLLIDALRLSKIKLPQEGIIHGDDLSLSIAAASVIAKVTRDRLMLDYHERFPHYGFDRHKGYGTREHLQNIRKFGPCPIHRTSFRGVR